MDISEKLRLLEEVCTSLACEDHAQLEYTSSFLVRGFNDAAQSGLRLPIQTLAVAVRRHALAALTEGKFTAAVFAINSSLDMPHGICLLKSHPEAQSQCQQEIAIAIIAHMFGDESLSGIDFAHTTKSVIDVIEHEDLKVLFSYIPIAKNPDDYEASRVDEACQALQGHGKLELPESLARALACGAARAMISAARASALQRSVDQGPTVCGVCWQAHEE